MKDLIVWIGLWFFVWGIFNAYLRWKWDAYKTKKYLPRGLFFLLAFLAIYYQFHLIISEYMVRLVLSFLLLNTIGLLLSLNRKYYQKFSKDRFYILFQSFNIFYQQTSILIAILLLKKFVGDSFSDIHFGLFFLIIHSPLAFFPWIKLKYWVLTGCFLGGYLFSYLNLSFYYGIIISSLIHYVFYAWEIYYLKDEEKI
jgi:hypothetical protein